MSNSIEQLRREGEAWLQDRWTDLLDTLTKLLGPELVGTAALPAVPPLDFHGMHYTVTVYPAKDAHVTARLTRGHDRPRWEIDGSYTVGTQYRVENGTVRATASVGAYSRAVAVALACREAREIEEIRKRIRAGIEEIQKRVRGNKERS